MTSIKLEEIFNDAYLRQFCDSWDVRPTTKHKYRLRLGSFKNYCMENELHYVTKNVVLSYKQYLLFRLNRTGACVSGHLTAIRSFFVWLEEIGICNNIARHVKNPPRTRKHLRMPLNIGQIVTLLGSMGRATVLEKRNFAIINLMIHTGLRNIEIVRIQYCDLSISDNKSTLRIHGKGRLEKDEQVLLTNNVLSPILEYLELRGAVNSQDHLFGSHAYNSVGRPLSSRFMSLMVKRELRKININDARITAHSLRHTAITVSLLAGASLQQTAHLARHTNVNTTMIYAHNIDRFSDEAPEYKIAKYIQDNIQGQHDGQNNHQRNN